MQATLTGYVGFDSITQQIEKKLLKRGFTFNLMVVGMSPFLCITHSLLSHALSESVISPISTGRTGLGKSTLVNTIFASHLIDSKAPKRASDAPRQTTEITSVTNGNCLGRLGVQIRKIWWGMLSGKEWSFKVQVGTA